MSLCVCFLVPRCAHTPKDRLFGLEVCNLNLTVVSCSEVSFWLDGSRFCGSFLFDKRVRESGVIGHGCGAVKCWLWSKQVSMSMSWSNVQQSLKISWWEGGRSFNLIAKVGRSIKISDSVLWLDLEPSAG